MNDPFPRVDSPNPKKRLHEVLVDGGAAFSSAYVVGKKKVLFARAKRRRLEGIVGKRVSSSCQPKHLCHNHWSSPDPIAEVHFSEWRHNRPPRHPVFLGLRQDKAAREVLFALPLRRSQ